MWALGIVQKKGSLQSRNSSRVAGGFRGLVERGGPCAHPMVLTEFDFKCIQLQLVYGTQRLPSDQPHFPSIGVGAPLLAFLPSANLFVVVGSFTSPLDQEVEIGIKRKEGRKGGKTKERKEPLILFLTPQPPPW